MYRYAVYAKSIFGEIYHSLCICWDTDNRRHPENTSSSYRKQNTESRGTGQATPRHKSSSTRPMKRKAPISSTSKRLIKGDGRIVQQMQSGITQPSTKATAKSKPHVVKSAKEKVCFTQDRVQDSFLEKANKFNRHRLLRKCGFDGLRKLVKVLHLRQQKAESHFSAVIMSKYFSNFKTWCKNHRYRRKILYLKCRRLHRHRVRLKWWRTWKHVFFSKIDERRKSKLSVTHTGTEAIEGYTVPQTDTFQSEFYNIGNDSQRNASCPRKQASYANSVPNLNRTTTTIAEIGNKEKELAIWAEEFRNGKLRKRVFRAWRKYMLRKKRSREAKARQNNMMQDIQKWLAGSSLD